MPWFVFNRIVICVPLIFACWPVAAQTSSYHTELEEHPAGHPHVVLVNDSEKSIEAFAVSQRCKTGGFSAIVDILHSPRNLRGMEPTGNAQPPRNGVLEPGARWVTAVEIIQDASAMCKAATIDAVLFTDGSFEGKQKSVRALKARRDGIVAGVNFWVERIAEQDPNGSAQDALTDEARNRVAEDRKKEKPYPDANSKDDDPWQQPLQQYWIGRQQVDENIRQHLARDPSTEPARERFREVAIDLDVWKKKIESNAAQQKLNRIFPPISDPVAQ